jgi:hypothetical protein
MKDISAIYQDIYPTLEIMEVKRIKTRRQGENIFFIALAILGLLGVVAYLSIQKSEELSALMGVLAIITIAVSGGIYFHKTNKLKDAFKEEVVTEIIQAIDKTFHYSPKRSVSQAQFQTSQLFSKPDNYTGEDYVSGKLDKTDFEFSEIHAQEESRDSDGDTTYSTIFKGFFMVADFHKHFHGHTVVVPDRTGEGWFGRVFKGSKRNGKQLAKMENPEFEKAFDVYATDQVEARYILTPNMLENIMNLKKRFNATVHLAFINSCVYIAISWRKYDFLEPNLKNSLLEESTIHKFLDDVWVCLDIIEDMNLNTRIWTK